MRYESKKTQRGNVGVSYESQEAADNQSWQMDANGCYNCSDCSDCYNCYNCSDCYNCSSCSGCSRCYNCSGCSGVLRWSGSAASSLLALNGLTWPVATDGKSIQIGCQHHSVEAWRGFSDAEISRMEKRALVFWQAHKDQILLLAEMRRSMNV